MPRKTVIARACVVWVMFFSISLWCAQVTVTPEARRIVVFNRGIWKGLNGDTPVGGQIMPISGVGARLL